jgi:hypothetical protein
MQIPGLWTDSESIRIILFTSDLNLVTDITQSFLKSVLRFQEPQYDVVY